MYNDYHITMDSFGDECPRNWQEIANYLNERIDSMDITDEFGELTTDGREAIDDLWERYCAGQIEGAPKPIMDIDADAISTYVRERAPFSWPQFNSLPSYIRDGVEAFWAPGYDYSDPDFWGSYGATTEVINAVQMYDWLMTNAPEGCD